MMKFYAVLLGLLLASANVSADEYETIRTAAGDWIKHNSSCTQKQADGSDPSEYRFVMSDAQKLKDGKIVVIGYTSQKYSVETHVKMVFKQTLDRYVVISAFTNKNKVFQNAKSEFAERKDGEFKDFDCRMSIQTTTK